MNSANFIGRIVNTPELRQTQSGLSVTSFTIAVDRAYSKGTDRQTDWIDIVAWRSTAEFICKYFQKGSPIVIKGHIETRNWEDKQGNKRKSVEVVAEEVEFVPRNKLKGEAVVPIAEPVAAVSQGNAEDFETVSGEDLPF